MIDFRSLTVASALALAVAGAATPALAAQRTAHPGYAARAQAVPGDVSRDGIGGHRAAAIRDCTTSSDKFSQYAWGNRQFDEYRACMAEHGEAE